MVSSRVRVRTVRGSIRVKGFERGLETEFHRESGSSAALPIPRDRDLFPHRVMRRSVALQLGGLSPNEPDPTLAVRG